MRKLNNAWGPLKKTGEFKTKVVHKREHVDI